MDRNSRYLKRLFAVFPVLNNKNYRLYFLGQLVSLIGTWLQIVAQGWLVLQLTNSPFLVGLVAAIGSLPTLLFSLFGGVIIDRFPKKQILMLTQISSMTLAFILGILTVFDLITVWQIGILAFLLGVVNALDIPTRQAFVPEMVIKNELPSAISLNAGTFNAARVIGPGLAGFLIAIMGTGGAFILNGISYIAVIIALILIQVEDKVFKTDLHPLAAIKEGISYSFTHPIIRTLLIFVGVVSVFGWSYTTIMPVIAQNTFHQGATGLGYLYAAAGLGALMATFVVSIFANKFSPLFFIIGGNSLFAMSLILFTFTTNFNLALILLFFAGLGLLTEYAMMNTTVQHLVADSVRGRVMSIYVLMFLGLSPLGNFEIGYLSEKFGTEIAIRIGAIIVFLFGTLVFFYRKRISTQYAEYNQKNHLI
ncbi:MFS transporter [Candidatus Daviesbacteria bacterium RIFCSPHIGHO2_02_FULL_39_12]|uniref:MFS transporter n=1 Tax=Candidatus Daviesbacteria bacterium RIFCSPHIGHO2_02_FULL_39_12 TaxID=1797770 RepID=A0A1F5JCZ8_9BACT|nr:MAG: MFS transporter [Candidatus Daviesbacteria bacterium RIFCSPHIGHO2_02_FULL_39_12]